MDSLVSLVYISSATHLLDPDEIDLLITHAHASNTRAGITSLLMHNGGNFMQCLEGTPGQVETTFNTIRAHRAHRSVIQMLSEPIGQRQFAPWPIAFLDIEGPCQTFPSGIETKLRNKLLPSETLLHTCSLRLLSAFYRNNLDRP